MIKTKAQGEMTNKTKSTTQQLKSLVLNLQPLLKEDSLFEILLESKEKDKEVGPHRMAFDMSPIFINEKIKFPHQDGTFCRSFFPQEHGNQSDNRVDNTKIIYQKKPQDPRAFLTSSINEVKITEEDQNGIWSLEFKVIRDSLYDATKIDGLVTQKDPQDSFYECDGHVASSQFISDIHLAGDAVFNDIGSFESSSVDTMLDGSSKEYIKYKLNYDWIKIVFYGASIEKDFNKIYAKNELYGTKTATIAELVDGGEYFLKDSNDDYILATNEDGDDIEGEYKIFTFDRKKNTFSNGDLVYTYNKEEDLFGTSREIKALIGSDGEILNNGYRQVETLDFKNQNILIDAYGNTLQLNPGTAKYVNEKMAEINDNYLIQDEETIKDQTERDKDYKPTKRNNTVEFTPNLLVILGDADSSLKKIIDTGIMFDDRFNKILINFDFSKIEENKDSYSHIKSNSDEENYYYPNAGNIENDDVKQAVSVSKSNNDEGCPSIIFDNGLRNDENSYVRDFVIFGHLFEYFTTIEKGVSITETDDNDRRFYGISLFEARRINPLLWDYINSVWDKNRSNNAKDFDNAGNVVGFTMLEDDFNNNIIGHFLTNPIDITTKNRDQIGITADLGDATIKYFDFIDLNYYKLSQATRDKHEAMLNKKDELGNETPEYPLLINIKTSLQSEAMNKFSNFDDRNRAIVFTITRLSEYLDDINAELADRVFEAIIKLTKQMTSLQSEAMNKFSNFDDRNRAIVFTITRLSEYLDDINAELADRVFEAIIKLTRQMN